MLCFANVLFSLLFHAGQAAIKLPSAEASFCECYFLIFFMGPYAPAQVKGGSRNFYTWWTLSVNREVTTWIFFLVLLKLQVGRKVTKFGIFSDPACKLSALTPKRGRIL